MSNWIVVAAALSALVAGGCRDAKTTATVGTSAPAAPTIPGAQSPDPATQRAAAIYASAIRRVVTRDHTFGGADPGFQVVYVLDGAVARAADPMAPSGTTAPAEPFDPALKDAIERALPGLPPIEFVRRRASVIVGRYGRVKGRGVFLTLGPIRGHENRVRVAASLWSGARSGQWLTYVVRRRGERWRVTGTTGPVVIS